MKLTDHTYVCNSLTNFLYELHVIWGNGNDLNLLKHKAIPGLNIGFLYTVHSAAAPAQVFRCCVVSLLLSYVHTYVIHTHLLLLLGYMYLVWPWPSGMAGQPKASRRSSPSFHAPTHPATERTLCSTSVLV